MGRVHLNVGDASAAPIPPTSACTAVNATAGTDPNLEALCFQFGRYILASSSRVGGQPANLQGIWNEALCRPGAASTPSTSTLEMNYWPAEVCNLSECNQPLVRPDQGPLRNRRQNRQNVLLQLRRLGLPSQHRPLARHGARWTRCQIWHVAGGRRLALPASLGALRLHAATSNSSRNTTPSCAGRPSSFPS
jgi:hypothetical protein